MIKKTNKAKMLQRLEQLQSKVKSKASVPIVLGLETWLNSDDQCASFKEYALLCERKNPNANIIIDDMAIQSDMYIDTGLILDSDRETMKLFINLAEQGDEIQYIKAFIGLFDKWMDMDDLAPDLYEEAYDMAGFAQIFDKGRYLTREEIAQQYCENAAKSHELKIKIVKEVLSESSNPFYLDFFNHYKVLSVEELIERYKDQKFFSTL